MDTNFWYSSDSRKYYLPLRKDDVWCHLLINKMEKQGKKILIVDDEPDILDFLSYNLSKEGYQIFTASDATLGIETAQKECPDMIILDIMMPGIDGVEMCRILRKDETFDKTLITFLTAREEDHSQIAAFDVGGDDYILKPLKPRVFLSRIQALFRRNERITTPDDVQDETTDIQISDLIISRDRISVLKGDSEISLAKKEYELLLLLVSKPGKVFTRDEIYTNVWGDDVIVGNRTIDVHIRKLREKIGKKYIKTNKGIGYKFEF